MKKIILLKTLSTGAFALVVLAGTSSFFLSSTAKAYDASTTSLSRCKEVKELWDQGDFTARFGSEAV
ncbi:hypothetical protein HOD24_04585, partial [Candidatus Peregrinibacteria bacterium]|nr:hypothetical protein [Candidatus Peregrinibacteria bacterium]